MECIWSNYCNLHYVLYYLYCLIFTLFYCFNFYINKLIILYEPEYRQRSEDKFLNNIDNKFGEKNDIVIFVGDWLNKQGSCINMLSIAKHMIYKRNRPKEFMPS